MPKKTKRGRPKIEFNYEEIRKLAALQCTLAEIASFCECSIDTVKDRKKNDPEFSAALEKGKEEGKISMRRAQYRVAVDNENPSMLIWLGKQYLGQTDKQQVSYDVFYSVVRELAAVVARNIDDAETLQRIEEEWKDIRVGRS